MDAGTSSTHNQILLVDDDNSSRLLVGAILRRLGYKVEQASCAKDARARINALGFDHFDLVISDYWMPEQNGLELLKYITLEDPTLSVMLMTGNGERKILENLIQINGCGFLQKPVGKATLETRVKEAVSKTRRLRHLRATESEANTLGENQRILLQSQLAAEWEDIEFFFTSKSQASGDFVSVIPLQDGNKVLLVSDASGHELSSALQSNYFHGLARGMLKHGASLEEVFEHFNDILLNEWNHEDLIGHSLAAIALRFNQSKRTLRFINAGAPHPMLSNENGFSSPIGISDGFAPLGWFDEPFHGKTIEVEPGYVCAWTDGLSDLAESLEIDPLSLADRFLNKSLAATSILAGAQDDIAVVRVKTPCTPAAAQPMIPLISVELSGDRIKEIDALQAYCERSIRIVDPQIASGFLADLLVCLREALVNALKHGCKSSPDLKSHLLLSRSSDASKISIQVRDQGPGHNFDWQSHATEAAENLIPEHRGLIMMQAIPYRTDFTENGSCVLMEFECDPSQN